MGTNPLLANALDLDEWADTLESRGAFPELMRRLLAQTPGITNIDIRAHEGTAAPGWDGTATSDGSSFLPKGELRFEFGTDKQPKTKADADYEKRVEKVPGKSDEIFIFATPRNWANAASWAKGRRQEGVFASVEVYDAHRLEGWLQSTPAVHYWLSEKIGKPVEGAQTLTSWWEGFRGNCTIKVPSAFHAVGREKESKRLVQLLREEKNVPAVQATWRNDALAFCLAALNETDTAALERTLVVSNKEAWYHLATQTESLIMIPLFEGPDIGLGKKNRHRIIRVLDECESARNGSVAIILPKIDRIASANLLKLAQVDYLEANRLSALARRCMAAFYRRISLDPARRIPGWAKDDSVTKYLAALVLVGGWEDKNARDREVISMFLKLDYDKITHILLQVLERYPDDPPFTKSGNRWYIVDPIDVADQVLMRLSKENLDRWQQLVSETLLCEHKKLIVGDCEKNGVGEATCETSATIKTCVAKALALVAQISGDEECQLLHVRHRLQEVIRFLLAKGFNDRSDNNFVRLNCALPYIAEAEPSIFLDVLEKDLLSSNPVIGQLVSGNSWAGWTSPNRLERVVAALQCVFWLNEYAGRAMMLMAQLSRFDCSREEVEYLADQFATAMVGRDRISVIGEEDARYVMLWVLDNCPKLFDLLVNRVLVRDFWNTSSYVPVYHDWVLNGTSSDEVLFAERQKDMLGVFVNYLEENAQCWLRVLHLLERLEQTPRDYLLDSFKECYLDGRFDADQQFECWSYLHALMLDRHVRQCRDRLLSWGGFKTLSEVVEFLEPQADPRRYAWLFGRPERLCVRGLFYKDEGFQETLWVEREAALSVTMREGGESLRVLVDATNNAACIGECLAGLNSCPEALILSWFGESSLNLRSAASSYVLHKARRDGAPWVIGFLEGNSLSPESKCVFVASLPCDEKMLELVSGLEFELRVAFLKHVNLFEIDEQQRACVLDELLEFGCVAQVVELLSLMLSVGEGPDAANIFRALSMLLVTVERDRCILFHDVVVELFSFLESMVPDHSDLPRLELLFSCRGYGLESLRALYRYFGYEPDYFAECIIAMVDAVCEEREDFEVQLHFNEIICWWQIIPGLQEDGTVDSSFLMGWVEAVQKKLVGYVSAEKSELYLGYVLASSPDGADGMWPAEAVRSVIEHMKSSVLERGISTRCYNRDSRGTRRDYIGGVPEWCLVNKYREFSRCMTLRWPRTAALLSRLAEDYEIEARQEDTKAEEKADEG